MLELYADKVIVQTNERDVSYFVLNFGGVFYEGPGIPCGLMHFLKPAIAFSIS